MTVLRVAVFDHSASIRTLLSREVEQATGLTCVRSDPTSDLLEMALDIQAAEVLVVGFDRNEEESWSDILAKIDKIGAPTVLLSPPGGAGLIANQCSDRCLSLEKPKSPKGWESLCSILIATVAGMEILPGDNSKIGNLQVQWGRVEERLNLIAVGGSAGGPDATGVMLKTVGPALEKATVLAVQHIGEGFEIDYVHWLSGILPWTDVRIAMAGETVKAGQVRIAGPGSHLEISEGTGLRLDPVSPPENGHRPSVDRLFRSVARTFPGGDTAGVLLSGMGIDGVQGLLALKNAGCLTMVQDRTSSAVFGMPRAALECGATSISKTPGELGAALKEFIQRGRGQ